jgi:hypothetical protein
MEVHDASRTSTFDAVAPNVEGFVVLHDLAHATAIERTR